MAQVRIRYFASLREDFGINGERLNITGCATPARILTGLAERHPSHAGLLLNSRIAVDDTFVANGDCIDVDREIAIIPPVSGG